MASVQECETALRSLAERLAALDPELRARHAVTRTLACRVLDLDGVFLATLNEDGLEELRHSNGDSGGDSGDRAQVRLATRSDDLLALVDGELSLPSAWATGRLKVQASPMDLLKLRALL